MLRKLDTVLDLAFHSACQVPIARVFGVPLDDVFQYPETEQ
jgi:hypothetical protein